MSGIDSHVQTIVGIGMLLVGVPYIFRNRLRRVRLPLVTLRAENEPVRPCDVLQLVERTVCPAARGHLIAALNCLLESPDAASD
jgi:hypothetical protein